MYRELATGGGHPLNNKLDRKKSEFERAIKHRIINNITDPESNVKNRLS